jgi:CheY-like chemotaxis protein
MKCLAGDPSVLFALADHVPAMLAYWDAGGRCRFANRAHQTWFGIAPEQILALDIAEFLGPLYAVSQPHIGAALRGDARRFERDVPDLAGGAARRVQTNYIPDVANGVVQGFTVLVVDLSRTETGARLAHELNSPLASVFANLERTGNALDQALVDPTLWRPMLADVGEAATRIASIVKTVAARPATPVCAHATTGPRRRRLLIVDDDRALAQSLQRLLAADYDTAIVTSSHDAIAQLTSADPYADLVLCDVMMPGATGLDVRNAVAAVHPELAERFVFMSGGAPDAIWHALEREPVPVIEKPFASAALRAALASR